MPGCKPGPLWERHGYYTNLLTCTLLLRFARRLAYDDAQGEQVSQGIDRQMNLIAFSAFRPIVAGAPYALRSGLHRPAIKNRGSRISCRPSAIRSTARGGSPTVREGVDLRPPSLSGYPHAPPLPHNKLTTDLKILPDIFFERLSPDLPLPSPFGRFEFLGFDRRQ